MQKEIDDDKIKDDKFKKARSDKIKNKGTPADMTEKEKEIKAKKFKHPFKENK